MAQHIVILGGSLSGLLAAHVLAQTRPDAQITLVEADVPGEGRRKGVPQAQHPHGYTLRSWQLLDALLPGLRDDVIARGAVPFDVTADLAMLSPSGWLARFHSGLSVPLCSRALLETCVRERALRHPTIGREEGALAQGLAIAEGRVTAVQLADGRTLPADLVIDAMGRGSKLPQWLLSAGGAAPEESVVDAKLVYTTRVYDAPSGFAHKQAGFDWLSLYAQPDPPRSLRGGNISVIEGGKWLVCLYGLAGDQAPVSPEGFDAFARSLRTPAIFAAMQHGVAVTEPIAIRSTANRFRHYERVQDLPRGLLVMGDALCTFNPVYAQGITVLAEQARALGRLFAGAGRLAEKTRAAQRKLARLCASPWVLASSDDYRSVPGGKVPASVRWSRPAFERLLRTATHDRAVTMAFFEVFHMLKTPVALADPRIWLRTLKKVPSPGDLSTPPPAA